VHAQPDVNVSSGSNVVELSSQANVMSQLEEGRVDAEHIGNTDWQAIREYMLLIVINIHNNN